MGTQRVLRLVFGMRFFHLSFEKGGAKELEWGLVKGFDRARNDIPYESL